MLVADGSSGLEVSFDENARRFEAHLPGSDDVAFIEVAISEHFCAFTHTEVPKSFQGRGIGSALVKAALHHLRETDTQVRPVCPFVLSYLRDHPDEADVVHPRYRHLLD